MTTGLFHLLADHGHFQNLGGRFRAAESVGIQQVVLLAGVVLAVLFGGLIVVQLVRWKKQKDFNNPWALFRELCQAHQLKSSDRHLLLQLAKVQELKHPSLLFVEPERFEADKLGSLEAQPLLLIRDRLFGQKLGEAH